MRTGLCSTDEFSRQQRDCELVVTGNGKAAAGAIRGGAPDNIGQWAVRLNEIEVGRGNVAEFVTEVAHQRDALQKYFRQSHGRSDV